jgi:hypothetical protein
MEEHRLTVNMGRLLRKVRGRGGKDVGTNYILRRFMFGTPSQMALGESRQGR